MKTSQILCVVLAAALAVVSWQLATKSPEKEATEQTGDNGGEGRRHGRPSWNPAFSAIMNRTSCRAFADRLITEAQIDTLVRAAMAAPTARNQQPWQIVVVTDRDMLDSIAKECGNIKMAAEAPVAIVLCGDKKIAREKEAEEFWVQDISAASENLLLAAQSMGLGAVWCGIYPIPDRVKFISSLLELPADIIPLNVIPVGYPKDKLQPKDKYDEDRVHYNTY